MHQRVDRRAAVAAVEPGHEPRHAGHLGAGALHPARRGLQPVIGLAPVVDEELA